MIIFTPPWVPMPRTGGGGRMRIWAEGSNDSRFWASAIIWLRETCCFLRASKESSTR